MTGVLAVLLALTGTVPAVAQDNVIDEVVWVVGDEAILKSDVENERLNAQYEGRRFDGDPYCVIPEELAVQNEMRKQDTSFSFSYCQSICREVFGDLYQQ